MRALMLVFAVCLGLSGLGVLGVGTAATAYVGPDDRVELPRQTVDVDGVALRTAPGFFSVYGPELELTVTSRDGSATPIFVATTPSFQATDYLRAKQHAEITGVTWSEGLRIRPVEGTRDITEPAILDIWSVREQGTSATLPWTLPDNPDDVVIMRVDGSSVGMIDIDPSLQILGLFRTGLLVVLGGSAAIVASVMILIRTRQRPASHDLRPQASADLP